MILLLMVLACAPKPVALADVVAGGRSPGAVGVRPSGVVYEGVFTDEMHAFSLPVGEGWVAEPGPEAGLMRVAVEHVATGTRVEIWAFSGTGLEPHVREGCTWEFRSKGRLASYAEETLVATCVPVDALDRRVYGTIFERGGTTFQIEVQPPNDALMEGRSMAEVLLSTLAW
jgi:hypothetical protein